MAPSTATSPKGRRGPSTSKRSRRKLKVDEEGPTAKKGRSQLHRALKGCRSAPLFVTAMFTGIAAGEKLRGLRWVNVELPKTGSGKYVW